MSARAAATVRVPERRRRTPGADVCSAAPGRPVRLGSAAADTGAAVRRRPRTSPAVAPLGPLAPGPLRAAAGRCVAVSPAARFRGVPGGAPVRPVRRARAASFRRAYDAQAGGRA